jgi:Holliday junction resolvase RusA-like endonuclease
MRKIRFTILGRLAGSNEIKYADRSHWSKGAKLRKADLDTCLWSLRMANLGQNDRFMGAVSVSFTWFEPNAKRDPDNIIGGQKAALDSLVTAGILFNDTRRWIRGLSHIFPDPDPKNPRIEVEVTEL